MNKVDNSILVMYDMIIDLDVAFFRLMKKKYNNPELVDQNIININEASEIKKLMINRKQLNPLELLIPDGDTNELYKQFNNDEVLEQELLDQSIPTDIFGLIITFLKEASSVSIDVLCKNKLESDFIKSLNSSINTIIEPDFKKINLSNYTMLYLKYFASILSFNNIAGKHIYIANARYNMDKQHPNLPDGALSVLYGDVNIIHTIDLYTNIKIERTY